LEEEEALSREAGLLRSCPDQDLARRRSFYVAYDDGKLGWASPGKAYFLRKSHDTSENHCLEGSLEGAGSFKCTCSCSERVPVVRLVYQQSHQGAPVLSITSFLGFFLTIVTAWK
jgi:hypothetical protein